jgi:hypothetical protein
MLADQTVALSEQTFPAGDVAERADGDAVHENKMGTFLTTPKSLKKNPVSNGLCLPKEFTYACWCHPVQASSDRLA